MIDYIILRNSVEQAAWRALSDIQRQAQMEWESTPPYERTTPDPGYFKGKKFRVIQEGYEPRLEKLSQLERTLTGAADLSVGPVVYACSYTIRTKALLDESDDPKLGTKSDLESYYLLNDPSGTPSNRITLVDHEEVERTGFLVGPFMPRPLTTILVGYEAHYFIKIEFEEREAVA